VAAWAQGGSAERPSSSGFSWRLLQPLGEELERLLRFCLLLAGQVNALLREEHTDLGRHLEGVRGCAFRGQLQDARIVRIEPQLGDQTVLEVLGGELQLQDEDRTKHREVVQLDPIGCVVREERPLLLREQLAQRPGFGQRFADVCVSRRFHRGRADIAAGHRVYLDAKAWGVPQLLRKLVRDDGAQLHHGVIYLALDPARTHHDPCLGEAQIWRVEEVDLADLGVEGIDSQCTHGRGVIGVRDGELELHAVGVLDKPQERSQLLIRETFRGLSWTVLLHRAPRMYMDHAWDASSEPGELGFTRFGGCAGGEPGVR
jgi:hypothetical protein